MQQKPEDRLARLVVQCRLLDRTRTNADDHKYKGGDREPPPRHQTV